MVDSVNNDSTSLAQIMLLYQQQQAQLNANNNGLIQNGSPGTGAVQSLSGNDNNNFFTPQGMSGDALLALLEAQQAANSAATPPTASADTSGQSSGQPSTFRQDFQSLVSSIKSGDLASAQQAYTVLTQAQTGNAANDSNTSTNGQSGQNSFQQALSQIGSDLHSGNITGAQQTLASLQQTQAGSGGTSSTASASSSISPSTQPGTISVTNVDGSITTITTNADGSVSTTTTPPDQTTSYASNILQDLISSLQQTGLV